MTAEIVLMWIAVTAYALGAVFYVVAAVFERDAIFKGALWISLLGLLPHAAAIAMRWARVGHGPYLGFYEVVSSFAFIAVAVLGLLTLRYRSASRTGVVLMPVAFLLIGSAMFAPTAELEITGTLASWWLTIHVAFAKLSFAALIAAFAVAVAYLLRDSGKERLRHVLAKLPSQEVLDDLAYRLVGVGFIFLGIMIACGAVWANEAWGRYWAWDPIETWSLIAWIIYAVVMHLRLTMGWRGRKAAWAAVAALPTALFALIGVPLVYASMHGAYLLGY